MTQRSIDRRIRHLEARDRPSDDWSDWSDEELRRLIWLTLKGEADELRPHEAQVLSTLQRRAPPTPPEIARLSNEDIYEQIAAFKSNAADLGLQGPDFASAK